MTLSATSYKSASFLADVQLLLVDPDKTNRQILSGLIEDLKPRRFMAVKSLAEAVSALTGRVAKFGLILLAVKNPPLSGFHFLQEIRAGGLGSVDI